MTTVAKGKTFHHWQSGLEVVVYSKDLDMFISTDNILTWKSYNKFLGYAINKMLKSF